MCPNKDWFSSFEKLDECSVVMGDNRPCNMEGMGMIYIKIFNGMVRELKEVRNVPQIKRNLISVGVLEALVLKYLLVIMFSWLKARWLFWRASDAITFTTW